MSSKTVVRESPERRQRVQSVEMGMTVLKALGDLGGTASLTAIANQVGEMPPKIHRYLASLLQEGLVVQEQGSQRYQLGPEIIRLGLSAMRLVDPVRVAAPSLVRLCDKQGVTAILAVMGNMGPTIVRWEEPLLPVTVNVRVGSVMPVLWSASGRAFLAFSTDGRLRQLALAELEQATEEKRTSLKVKNASAIDRMCAEIRTRGFAVAADSLIKGMSGIAAPILDFSGYMSAAITVLGPKESIDPSPDGSLVQALLTEARHIGELMGHSARFR